ncbi:acetyltransferase [bacterium D16-51]|nr:acetyltransferase [bacterium D16-59]RKI55886.1 acetyltransferase [bacterium D16-51]
MNKKILLIGGGGHCCSVLDSLFSCGDYEQIGVIERNNSSKKSIMDVPIVGTDDDLFLLHKRGWTDAFIALGSVGDTAVRRKIYCTLKEIGYTVPVITDSTAIIGENVQVSEGVFIGKRAIVNAGVCIKRCAIINSGAIVEHGCMLGSFSHISSGAVLCGQVKVGDDSHIGAASVIRQSVCIGNNTLIGVGSVVVKDLPNAVLAYGNPCEVRKEK